MENNRQYGQLIRAWITQRLRRNPHLLAGRFPFPVGKDGGQGDDLAVFRPVYGPGGSKQQTADAPAKAGEAP